MSPFPLEVSDWMPDIVGCALWDAEYFCVPITLRSFALGTVKLLGNDLVFLVLLLMIARQDQCSV